MATPSSREGIEGLSDRREPAHARVAGTVLRFGEKVSFGHEAVSRLATASITTTAARLTGPLSDWHRSDP